MLFDVLDVVGTQAWAVGMKDGGHPLLARWNGTAWRAVRTPGEPPRRILQAIDAGVDGTMMIAGDAESPLDTRAAFALQRCPAP